MIFLTVDTGLPFTRRLVGLCADISIPDQLVAACKRMATQDDPFGRSNALLYASRESP